MATPGSLEDENGLPVVVFDGLSTTTWEPTIQERAKIACGGRVGVIVEGEQPAMVVAVAAPLCESCGAVMGWSDTLEAYTCSHSE